jgi:hypothetical protein
MVRGVCERYLHDGEIRLEFASGRIDYYRGIEAQQVANAMQDFEIPVDYADKPPNLNKILDFAAIAIAVFGF